MLHSIMNYTCIDSLRVILERNTAITLMLINAKSLKVHPSYIKDDIYIQKNSCFQTELRNG